MKKKIANLMLASLLMLTTLAGISIADYAPCIDNIDNIVRNKIDPWILARLPDWDNQQSISVIVHAKSDISSILKNIPQVEGIGRYSGEMITVRTVVDTLVNMSQMPDVIWISGGAGPQPFLDVSIQDVEANHVWNMTKNNKELKGSGVIVGVVDSGIDYTHEDFWYWENGFNKTRILYLWDQKEYEEGTPPDGYGYGAEWTKEDINDALNNYSNPFDRVPQKDKCGSISGHGTHVTSIATGDGSASDSAYMGVAPEANIIFVRYSMAPYSDSDIAKFCDALDYLVEKAKAIGKPIVINLSVGGNFGRHDGTCDIEKKIDSLSDPGVIFVTSAGNNADDDCHASGYYDYIPPNDQDGYQEWWVRKWQVTQCEHDIYYDNEDLGIMITTPPDKNGETSTYGPVWLDDEYNYYHEAYFKQEGGTEVLVKNRIYIKNYKKWYNNDRYLYVYITQNGGDAPFVFPGIWSYTLKQPSVEEFKGRFDSWFGTIDGCTLGDDIHYLNADPEMTISEPSCANRVIAVGAYTTKPHQYWDRKKQCFVEPVIQNITWFSSLGPTYDGREKPEITAPGWEIRAAQANTINDDDGDDSYTYMGGTSMSCPHVVGAIAQMLQVDPNLTPEKAREYLIESTRKDTYTGYSWDNAFGYGKMDISKSIGYLSNCTINSFEINNGTPATNNRNVQLRQSSSSLIDMSSVRWRNTDISASWSKVYETIRNPVDDEYLYPKNYYHTWVLSRAGALKMDVHFTQIDLGLNDSLYVLNDNDIEQRVFHEEEIYDEWVLVSGDTVKIRLISSNDWDRGWGFNVDEWQYYDYPGDWESYKETDNWILTNGEGQKIVECLVRDGGNITQSAEDDILYDITATPPVVCSSTHPNENMWYSNNNPSFNWSEPNDASGIRGYWYVFDHYESTIPTTSDSWTTSDTKNYYNVADGKWYFHIVSEDNAGNVGTIADHYEIKVDTTPPNRPNVSSSTHPDQNKWYSNNNPNFCWDPPSDLSGIQGYYYILDQKSNTIPNPSTGNWTAETNKTFYDKPDDEWWFHIICKDNAGNVGTTTDHYRILIDTLPPTNSTIIINNNESQTSSPAVTLNVNSSDIHLDEMQFSDGIFHSVTYGLDSPGSWTSYADDSESDHPYLDNRHDVWWINHTGGSIYDIMRVHFTRIDTTEKEYDPRGGWVKDALYVKNQWQAYNEYVNKYENYLNEEGEWSKNVSGNKIKLVLDSSDGTDDPPRNGWGFKVDKYQVWDSHTYPNNYDNNWTITHPGALMMKVYFTKIDTQAWHDYVYIYDEENNEIARYDGYLTDFWTPAVDGDTIRIRLVTDSSVRGYGFEIDKYAHFSHGSWSDWEEYNNNTKEWNLTNGDGDKAVYFRTKDTANNTARYVHDTITLETGPPTAVSLSDPSPITNNSMILQWTENTDYDFQKYELHKSDTSGFIPDETTLYRGLAARSWLEQKLTELEPSTAYYYKVRVYDAVGNYNDSNEVNGTTTPSSVHLYNPTDIKSDSMILKWTRNNDVKFQKCQLHKSKTAGFTPSQSTLYKEDSDRTWIEEKIIGLESSTRYYFKVRVYDTIGQYIDSNEVNGRTMSGGSAGCPYVFVWNGPTCVKDNNILRGSQNLNRSQRDVIDYYKLEQDLVPKNGVYSMEIGEFENEYTNLNQLELMTIDHASDVNIAVTQDGVVLTYRDPMEPLSVIDRFGNDWLEAVNSTGGDYYEGYEGDYLVIDFGNPDTTFGAKLVLRADEKAWWGWHSRTEPRIWSSIKVQILNKTQQWENVGIIEPRDDWATEIVDLSPFISEMSNESFKIRLYWTQHHKLDYVGLDTSQQVDVSIQTYSISFALHSRFGDVTSQLVFQDENYTQILPADHISVAFPYVPGENETRDVVLVSKGYYYFVIDDIEVSQDVKVKLNVDGTVGNTVEMIILESSVSNRYHHLSVNSTIITVGESGNSVEATFKGYANRSYEILVRYITNGTGKNSVIIEVEFNDILEIKNINLDASEGAIQEMYIDIDDDLNETLYELNGTIFTKTNATINMEPNNLIEENDIFDWENIEWNFGDGTSLTTTNRTVTHEYETPGTYIVTVTVTYDDGTTVTETKEVSVS